MACPQYEFLGGGCWTQLEPFISDRDRWSHMKGKILFGFCRGTSHIDVPRSLLNIWDWSFWKHDLSFKLCTHEIATDILFEHIGFLESKLSTSLSKIIVLYFTLFLTFLLVSFWTPPRLSRLNTFLYRCTKQLYIVFAV